MLRVINKQEVYTLKHPLSASLTLSFASFGDAFLYPFLPQYAELTGIPVVWVGVLLSINRFIRIFFNPVVVRLFAKYGARHLTIIAAVLAIASTLGYGLGWGLTALIIFRMIWGMAFAIMRLSTLAYSLEHKWIGLSLGAGKSLQEAGPLLALWLGPFLLNYFSVTTTFWVLALASLPSLFYAISLPPLTCRPATNRKVKYLFPSLFNSMTFVSAFIVEGVLIIVAGVFLSKTSVASPGWAITSMVAAYLAYRRLSSILFSPFSGMIADSIGFTKVYHFSLLMVITGLAFLLMGWVFGGLIIVFTFNSINTTLAAGEISNHETDKIRTIATNASWRDAGAAVGTLAGGLLLSGRLLPEIFTIATFILTLLLFIHHQQTTKH